MTIISFEHKFVFIKTRKIAGTSIEVVLRKFLGEDDIASAITPRDESYAMVNDCNPRNYAENKADEDQFAKLVAAEEFEQAMTHLQNIKLSFVSHMAAFTVKRKLERKNYRWEDFFVFTVERHPYSWMLSNCLYDNKVYNQGKERIYGIADIDRRAKYLMNDEKFKATINYELYTHNEKLLVDRILRYENLPEEFDSVLKELGLDHEQLEFPDLKNNARHLDADILLNENIKNDIYEQFQQTFELMEYRR